ncbi:hypothetical protein GQ54DRAFT_258908, partial [Martensiomyces pterosporus]
MRFELKILLLAVVAVARRVPRATHIPSSSTPYWFPQPVDHFGQNSTSWNQQYVVNATFYKNGGPIYMFTPGENALSNFYTDNTHFTALAQRTNGLLVAMEHRFYGKSNPMPDLSGPSLKYMTIENVLEDFASFLRAARSSPSTVFPVPVGKDSKVIFGGGSYPGSIAAWMRAKYPKLVDGAWASSAVVYSRLLNYQLNQSFGRHLQALGCDKQVGQAVRDLDYILLSGNETAIAAVQEKFG